MLLGVIGDDFTGSSDIANNLKKAGMSVGMYSGVPDNKIKLNKYNAVVIALKTRTIPTVTILPSKTLPKKRALLLATV